MTLKQCPFIANCDPNNNFDQNGKCECDACISGYDLSQGGYACVLKPCPSSTYANSGSCVACPLPANCNVATCTSAADSTCTQCAATYVLSGGACVPDPCASKVAGAASGAGNVAFSVFVPFNAPSGGTTFQPGDYEIQYGDGCMKYGTVQGWTVNALGPDYTWYIGTALGTKLPGPNNVPPGVLSTTTKTASAIRKPCHRCQSPSQRHRSLASIWSTGPMVRTITRTTFKARQ